MKIEDVALFERIAELGSVSAAGEALGITPNLASERLARLERTLSCTLATRTTRSLSLTDEGRQFLERAKVLLEAYEEARHSVGTRSQEPTGSLRVTAPSFFGRLFLPTVIEAFLTRYPKAALDLSLSDHVEDYAARGFDLAIRIGNIPDSSYRGRKLGDNVSVLVASPAYLERYGAPQTPEDLKDHNCMVFAGQNKWTLETADGPRIILVSGTLRTDSAEIDKFAAVNGLGIALRSKWSIREELASGTLVQVLPTYPVTTNMSIWAIHPPGRYVSVAAKSFVELLQAELRTALRDTSA
ncbi:LysR family transcriptional regulator [Pseudovibrio exalbescens]|uniref:LysR family transcriptional regulator n=1 Tax=Pseudovibrio exalbescens TaxID=197461 RepID=UPI0023668B45|nr:LysR family transcriptional regulator [Pseudovibrio exalbescens]MDD7910813.1 LysR family transcriptional regulator [Pseudovibrio exalbescens]